MKNRIFDQKRSNGRIASNFRLAVLGVKVIIIVLTFWKNLELKTIPMHFFLNCQRANECYLIPYESIKSKRINNFQ